MESPQLDPLAVASLLLGFVSWCLGCCIGVLISVAAVIVVPVSLLGLVLGIVSARRIRAEPTFYTGMPLAVVGIVVNAGHLLLTVGLALLMVLVFAGILGLPMLEQAIGGF